ncbi:uncharacterized protein JCM10292_007387 [Rhodotorula paludigena]|uniref:uncharacterized protein n=1 Tax=Rhodotorula paludigena TaxID=86838 RepID=UPI003171D0FF
MLRSVRTAQRRRVALPVPALAALPLSVRLLSSSPPRLVARPPTFTTPEPAPAPPPPSLEEQQRVDSSKPLEPLPPTNLPVEDYASPLLHTASFFSSLFRYAVYGSVFIVLSTVGAVVAVHQYVEHVELAAPSSSALDPGTDDPDDWLAEREGWSGLHTAKRGGTDPRLGVFARAAIRGAWISQNWGAGLVASPVAAHGPAATSASPFGVARMGGDMIGARDEAASRGRQVSDAGWLLAERYLAYALERAANKGISLVDSAAWESHVDQGGVDRAAVELEERLAGVRERIGGRFKLEEAREGWERIYYALEASPTSATERRADAEWERREKLLATRKLGELSARIADHWREGSDERRFENTKAEGWFLGGLVPVLAQAEGQSLKGKALDTLVPGKPDDPAAATKHVSPSSSFFGFWARSHPPAVPPSPTAAVAPGSTLPALPPFASSAQLSPELQHLLALVSHASAPRDPSAQPLFSASTQRALLSSLVSLETFHARRKDAPASSSPSPASPSPSSLASAQSLQSASLLYARSLLPSSSSSPALLADMRPIPPALLSRALSTLFYETRTAALESHLAECTLALSALSAPAKGSSLFRSSSAAAAPASRAPAKADVAAARGLIASSSAAAAEVVDSAAALVAALRTAKGGEAKAEEKAFGESLRRVERDAGKVREMSAALDAFVRALEGGGAGGKK